MNTEKTLFMKKVILRGLFYFVSILTLLSLFYGGFVFFKLLSVGKKVNIHNQPLLETAKSLSTDIFPELRGVEKNKINILLLGIAGEGKPGKNLTDTIMIASIDTEKKRVAFLSLPRDLLISIPQTNLQAKINSAYQYFLGTSKNETEPAIENFLQITKNITGLDMDYYFILNFDGFQKIIDSIEGINVMNERDILDTRFPGPNYSYETFELAKGFHHLDGATALKYARERHGDPEGDFGRAKRQQQVIQAAKNKIFSTKTFLDFSVLNNLLNALGDNIKTNVAPQEIGSFIKLIQRLDLQNINTVVVDAWKKESLLKGTHVELGGTIGSVLVPRSGNYSEIKELAENIFSLEELKRKRAEIAKENSSIAIINQTSDNQITGKIRHLLGTDLDYNNISILSGNQKGSEAKTQIYDLTGGVQPFTLNELVTRLPGEANYAPTESLKKLAEEEKIDMVISLGKDLLTRYNKEEVSWEEFNQTRDSQEYLELIGEIK
ncbi:MAG: hypothetical protein COU40_02795 [Candidatus Moranbacteria bacterium CG10_big_fil_rev_8_21_14_0_10_35_21]|nr:MAG: hypothetical protein COU40_02795 [Candidatus Moranbacteria bacterium CG10_big_fil_rev_8_21_14_0_10_35_21]PJA88999.1 MAG: hypothetical protein CO139_00145 [Candidatus Moranbacteria bacterium CG_4_9_14_3_um_filter_36_9]